MIVLIFIRKIDNFLRLVHVNVVLRTSFYDFEQAQQQCVGPDIVWGFVIYPRIKQKGVFCLQNNEYVCFFRTLITNEHENSGGNKFDQQECTYR